MEADPDNAIGGRPSGGSRPLYVRRLSASDVGDRVSLRYRPTRRASGTQTEPLTDVVGRLLVHDEDLAMVVDRHGQLHVVPQDLIVASRTIPPHPRRAPEPAVGTRRHPVVRQAARLVVLDDEKILLIAHHPDPQSTIWTAPGGGLETDEQHGDAAVREAQEELGVTVRLGPWIWHRRASFAWRGVWLEQSERWFLAQAPAIDVGTLPGPDPAAGTGRWWSVDELTDAESGIAPARLGDHLRRLLDDGPPPQPIDIGP